jgi:hypothetical protein
LPFIDFPFVGHIVAFCPDYIFSRRRLVPLVFVALRVIGSHFDIAVPAARPSSPPNMFIASAPKPFPMTAKSLVIKLCSSDLPYTI